MKSIKRFKFLKNKRHFLLIEILIAFSLITMLSVPLIRNPIYYFRSQIHSLQKIELQKIADFTFLDIKLDLYKNNIPLSNLASLEKEAISTPLKPSLLSLPGPFKGKEVTRSLQIWASTKISKKNEEYKLISIKITLKPLNQKKSYNFKYKVVAKKIT